jgi:hypothetical protein
MTAYSLDQLGYGLDDQGTRVQFLPGKRNIFFSTCQNQHRNP